jgi:CheY-like chemotaxis protein
MAKIYDVQISNPPGVPAALEVHLRVKRRDGKALSRDDLTALAAAYPSAEAAVESAIARLEGERRSRPAKAPREARRQEPTRREALVEEVPKRIPRKDRKALGGASRGRPKASLVRTRVLLVEGDETLRVAIVRALRARGIGVDAFASPRDALAAVQGGRVWRRALIDLVLPDMDGATLAEEILKVLPEIEVTFATGGTGAAALCRAHSLGTVIWKPLGLGPLCERFSTAPWRSGAASHRPADATSYAAPG